MVAAADRADENPENRFVGSRDELVTRVLPAPILSVSDGRHSTFSDCTMTVTRRLALWAACVSVTTAQHYDDTRDGLWHVCSPAWAVPQLDDDSLNADEAWRVEKYLARAACSSSTPIICQICAGLAARADGASNAPGT